MKPNQPAATVIPPDTHTTSDLAKRLKLSERQLRRMAAAGTLPAPVKFGRVTRWTRVSIDDWLADGCPKRPDTVTTQPA